MITLQPIDANNFLEAAALKICPEQQCFLASAPMILARAYALRQHRAICWSIYEDATMVGIALVHNLDEEPACYHLQQFLIDASQQGRGFGFDALRLIMTECSREGKYPRMEVCVNRRNRAAIRLFVKAGFRDSGYTDPDTPECLCMICDLPVCQSSYDGGKSDG